MRAHKISAINRERFSFVMVHLIGTKVRVTMRNEAVYEGVFHSINVDGDFSFTLQNAREMAHPTNDERRSGPLIQTLMIPYSDFLALKESPPPPPKKSDERGENARVSTSQFKTDGQITSASGHDVQEQSLTAWNDPAAGRIDGKGLEEDVKGEVSNFDQFATNSQKLSVKSTYNEEAYTTKLDLNSLTEAQQKEAAKIAEKLAAEGETPDEPADAETPVSSPNPYSPKAKPAWLNDATNTIMLSQSTDPRERRTRGLRLNALNLELPEDKRTGPTVSAQSGGAAVTPLAPMLPFLAEWLAKKQALACSAQGGSTRQTPAAGVPAPIESKPRPVAPALQGSPPQQAIPTPAKHGGLAVLDEAAAKKGESKGLNALNLEPCTDTKPRPRPSHSPQGLRDRIAPLDQKTSNVLAAQQQSQQDQSNGGGNKGSFTLNPNATSFSPVNPGSSSVGAAQAGETSSQPTSTPTKGDEKGKGKGGKKDDHDEKKQRIDFTPLTVLNPKLSISHVLKMYTELSLKEMRAQTENDPPPKWDATGQSFREILGVPTTLPNTAPPSAGPPMWAHTQQTMPNQPGQGAQPVGSQQIHGQGQMMTAFQQGMNIPAHQGMMQQGVPMAGIPMMQMGQNMHGMQHGMMPNMAMQPGMHMQPGMNMPMGMPAHQQGNAPLTQGDQTGMPMMPNQGFRNAWEQ
eukprot:GEMP01001029.1.p1 GENE.GEMP01001029.1~~GEMP01001029.1.p1  ORF type:complete len:686 (+),score=137.50 GEMP01001029.1:341-2398(+)